MGFVKKKKLGNIYRNNYDAINSLKCRPYSKGGDLKKCQENKKRGYGKGNKKKKYKYIVIVIQICYILNNYFILLKINIFSKNIREFTSQYNILIYYLEYFFSYWC